jgi:hypothetical protein
MPHKSTFAEGACRINASFDKTDAAYLPDQGSAICSESGTDPILGQTERNPNFTSKLGRMVFAEAEAGASVAVLVEFNFIIGGVPGIVPVVSPEARNEKLLGCAPVALTKEGSKVKENRIGHFEANLVEAATL